MIKRRKVRFSQHLGEDLLDAEASARSDLVLNYVEFTLKMQVVLQFTPDSVSTVPNEDTRARRWLGFRFG